MQRRHYWRIYY